MNIQQALASRTVQTPFITRKAWLYITNRVCPAAIKLLPTNSPDCCIVKSESREGAFLAWQPTEADLLADDWYSVQ